MRKRSTLTRTMNKSIWTCRSASNKVRTCSTNSSSRRLLESNCCLLSFFVRIFKSHHLHIFRAVYYFHMRKYDEAFKEFQTAKTQKELHITEKRLARAKNEDLSDYFSQRVDTECNGEITEEEEDADLLEVLEIRFNELACLVMLKQYKKAKEKCKTLMDNINEAK